MGTVAGIFHNRVNAERGIEHLKSIGITDSQITLLSPGMSERELDAAVPTTETEQPGMGKALGGTVGGALGIAGGMHLGAVVASLFIPGVGPVLAAGLLAALMGAGGAAAGMTAGNAMEDSIVPGLPHDEVFVYEDALRRGHTVVIAITDDDAHTEAARSVLAQAGAESLDAARHNWWIGLRDAEEEEYKEQGGDFTVDETSYRRGFEAAVHPKTRGRSFEEASNDFLRERYPEEYAGQSFKRGYERGQAYQRKLTEKYQS